MARAAFLRHQDDCSGSVKDFLAQRGYSDFGADDLANDIMRKLPSMERYHQITKEEAARIADRGGVVIAGWINPAGSGHVQVIMAGPIRRREGARDGETDLYPPAMSGSNRGWEGARSDRSKTVRAAYGKDQWEQVTI